MAVNDESKKNLFQCPYLHLIVLRQDSKELLAFLDEAPANSAEHYVALWLGGVVQQEMSEIMHRIYNNFCHNVMN